MQLLAEFIFLGSGYSGELLRFTQKRTHIQSAELHQHCRTHCFVLSNFCWVIDSLIWHKSLVGCRWRVEEWNKMEAQANKCNWKSPSCTDLHPVTLRHEIYISLSVWLAYPVKGLLETSRKWSWKHLGCGPDQTGWCSKSWAPFHARRGKTFGGVLFFSSC